MAKLYVIAGHGAGDSGAQGNGYGEAERVRALAKVLKERGGNDVEVLDTTRNWFADGGISQLKLPAGAQIIELHMDSGVNTAKGGHVLYKPGTHPDGFSQALAVFIEGMFPGRSEKLRSQALGNATRAANKGYSYRLLECCFITNKADIDRFNSEMTKLADGILAAFGITGAKPTQPQGDDLKAINIPKGTYTVYRLYNPNNADHFFTSNKQEYDALVKAGWKGEGEAWKGADTGLICYRFYNPNNGDHIFTVDFAEAYNLQKVGWTYEGANFAAAREGRSVHRLVNPNNGMHMLTASDDERASLVKAGWKHEGVAFKAAG